MNETIEFLAATGAAILSLDLQVAFTVKCPPDINQFTSHSSHKVNLMPMQIMKWSLIAVTAALLLACSDDDAPETMAETNAPSTVTQTAPEEDTGAGLSDEQRALLGESAAPAPRATDAPPSDSAASTAPTPSSEAAPPAQGNAPETPATTEGNPDIGTRPLTDADVDKYVAITAGLAKLAQPAAHEEVTKVLAEQGMTYGEYSVLGTRINLAATMLGMGQSITIPDAIKADADVVSRNLEKINAVRQAPTSNL